MCAAKAATPRASPGDRGNWRSPSLSRNLERSWNASHSEAWRSIGESKGKMEAEGIEPSSESVSPNASTCVSDDLSSSPLLPSAGSPATSRRCNLSPRPVGTTGAQPELRRSLPPYGRGQGERGSLIRLPVRSFRWQLSRSVLFDEVNSTPGTQRSLHHLRRNQVAPKNATP